MKPVDFIQEIHVNRQTISHIVPFAMLMTALVLIGACDTGPKSMTGDQGLISIDVPSSWSKRTDLNDDANLQAGNAFNEEYLVVISEAKADLYQMNMQRYANFMIQNLRSSVLQFAMEPAQQVEINGMKGQKYICRGVIENINVSYVVTVLESDTHFHNVMMWTMRSKEGEAFPKFDAALQTFKEVQQTATETTATN
ncbi:MAG: hypothetical protein KDK34_23040 [Leptospiraceae bacterium]|nr:hypothetical protein [Leptospiraceae bacterium]